MPSGVFLALPSSFASAEHRDSIPIHIQLCPTFPGELAAKFLPDQNLHLCATHTLVFPQGFSALPSAVPPSLPMAGICSCSISSTQELNCQDSGSSGNCDSNGRNSYNGDGNKDLLADSLPLILPVPQAAGTRGCLGTQCCILFIALTSYYDLLNYFFSSC